MVVRAISRLNEIEGASSAAVRSGSSPSGCETGGDKRIGARSETIANWGMFQEAFTDRRGLVPAPVCYEWCDDPNGKTPFAARAR